MGPAEGHLGRAGVDRREPSAYADEGPESSLNHKMLWLLGTADR